MGKELTIGVYHWTSNPPRRLTFWRLKVRVKWKYSSGTASWIAYGSQQEAGKVVADRSHQLILQCESTRRAGKSCCHTCVSGMQWTPLSSCKIDEQGSAE